MTDGDALQEQIEYYRARAAEYDEWWLRQGRYDRGAENNAKWFAEAETAAEALEAFGPRGHILEFACGTGIWSERLLPRAESLTVVDGATEMLAMHEARLGKPDNIRRVLSDIFAWRPDRLYDTVFFSFWLSHVPPDRFEEFWELVRSALAPGGRVFFLDSRFEKTSTASNHVLTEPAAVTQTRRLNDGREFRIYKLFHDPAELEARLRSLGWELSVRSTDSYFLFGEGGRAAA